MGAGATEDMRGFGSSSGKSSWLLIKHRDQYASTEDIDGNTAVFGRRQNGCWRISPSEGGGDVAQAATGDPAGDPPKAVRP